MSQSSLIALVVSVIVASGSFGGVINYLLTKKRNEDGLKMTGSIVVGVGAAFLVPLFLYTVSSNLVNDLRPNQGNVDFSKYLVFAGFCLVASISSRAFIKTLSDRILKEVTDANKNAATAVEKAVSAEQRAKEAEEKASEAEVKANQAQSDVDPMRVRFTEQDSTETMAAAKAPSVLLSETERKVLETLAQGKYILRTRSGLARDSHIDKEIVDKTMEELKTKGLVRTTRIVKGDGETRRRWYITPEGKAALV